MTIDFKKIPLGALPSPEDPRDFVSTAIIPKDTPVPTSYSWKDKATTILMQDLYGICVGCAAAAIKNIQEVVGKDKPDGGFSPVYIYTLCKQAEGDPENHSWGTYPRLAMQVLTDKGALPYSDMPVSVLNTLKGNLPGITQAEIDKSVPYRISQYAFVPRDIDSLKQALVTQGPLMLSVAVTESFYNPEQGKYIKKLEGSICGGHAITIVGYNDNMSYTYEDGTVCKGFFEIQNSWGSTWGNAGFAYIPYSAFTWVVGANQIPLVLEMWSSIDYTPAPEKPKYWRIQTGAFSIKANAQKLQATLKAEGLATYLVYSGNFWKVQLGAFLSEENCRNESERLHSMGIPNFITRY